MKLTSKTVSHELTSLYAILGIDSAKNLTKANAANFIIYILLMRSLSVALTDFPQSKIFIPGGKTSNIHLVLIVGQVILQLRGYEDITSDDLYEYMTELARISHSNFRRVLDGAVKIGVLEKTYSSFDKRVKQYKISDYGFNNLVDFFGLSLGSLQQEFEETLISDNNHELNEACESIFAISTHFYNALDEDDLLKKFRISQSD